MLWKLSRVTDFPDFPLDDHLGTIDDDLLPMVATETLTPSSRNLMYPSQRSAFLMVALIPIVAASCQRTPSAGPMKTTEARTGIAEIEPLDENRIIAGQTIYVPAYSHVLTSNDARPFDLAVTLSIRNTDRTHAIVVTKVDYYDRDGRHVRSYIKKPLRVASLGAVEFFVKEKDTSGGSSASFLVDWVAENVVSAPLSETVMIGTASTQGISFLCPGRVIAERSR